MIWSWGVRCLIASTTLPPLHFPLSPTQQLPLIGCARPHLVTVAPPQPCRASNTSTSELWLYFTPWLSSFGCAVEASWWKMRVKGQDVTSGNGLASFGMRLKLPWPGLLSSPIWARGLANVCSVCGCWRSDQEPVDSSLCSNPLPLPKLLRGSVLFKSRGCYGLACTYVMF